MNKKWLIGAALLLVAGVAGLVKSLEEPDLIFAQSTCVTNDLADGLVEAFTSISGLGNTASVCITGAPVFIPTTQAFIRVDSYDDLKANYYSKSGSVVVPKVTLSLDTYGNNPAPASPNLSIYTDVFAPTWSAAKLNGLDGLNSLNATPLLYGINSISVQVTNPSGGVYVSKSSTIDSSSYTHLHFAAKTSGPNAAFQVFFVDSAGVQNGVTKLLTNYGGQPNATNWTIYDLPLSDFGLTNVNVKGFKIQDTASGSEPILYIDDVKFRGSSATPMIPFFGQNTFFVRNGNLTLRAGSIDLGNTGVGVIFVDGDLTLTTDILYGKDPLTSNDVPQDGLVFIVRGQININQDDEDPAKAVDASGIYTGIQTQQINAILIAEGCHKNVSTDACNDGIPAANIHTICSACKADGSKSDQLNKILDRYDWPLKVNGSLISLLASNTIPPPTIKLLRTPRDTNYPAELINSQAKYLVTLRQMIAKSVKIWSEE